MHTPPSASPPLPAALRSRDPRRWLAIFGPGAVLASLTIGVGELIFSSRAGALFGYRLLWLFALVLALKWILVLGSARHIVLTGAHPFQRWMDLPGPRGWFPLTFFLLALPCFPIWVCFHAGTLGTLTSALTGTGHALGGAAHLAWGAAILGATLLLAARGGYQALERVQLAIVIAMLASVVAALFFVRPDWAGFLAGLMLPQGVSYPGWVTAETFPEIAARPIWLETTTYLGVIGGSSYDYLAYTSYLRDKAWGRANRPVLSANDLAGLDAASASTLRQWLRAPRIDCALSFAAVLGFTAVFVICGATVLGPQHKVPAGSNLLSLQAEFLAVLHPWFRPVYFAGAFLAVLGTLYGTIEVAPTILREMALAFRTPDRNRPRPHRDSTPRPASAREPAPEDAPQSESPPALAPAETTRLRRWSIAWTGAGGLLVLGWTFWAHWRHGAAQAPGLIAVLTPANLFTGVLGCGWICLLNAWMNLRFLPPAFRPTATATAAGIIAGVLFVGFGLVACWDHSRWTAFVILGGTVLLGVAIAGVIAVTAAPRVRSGP